MLNFDHIEVHVRNSKSYAEFLVQLFDGGRIKRISDNNTYMFVSNDQLHIEIKENTLYNIEFNIQDGIGFCLPCLRMKGAKKHLLNLTGITISKEVQNPDGACIFFKDFENIHWHIKDYDCLDIYVNI
jgi:hypothetical protein